MLAKIASATLVGVRSELVEIEVEFAQGLPLFTVIGLGDTAVQEARFRIQSAFRSASIDVPRKRVTLNLAPAAVRKDGSALDLPMALGVLVAADRLEASSLASTLVLGELALSGVIRPVRGVVSAAALARRLGLTKIIVPPANAQEALAVGGLEVVAPNSLGELLDHLGDGPRIPDREPESQIDLFNSKLDMSEIRGQNTARRALEIAAAGGHNVLFIGPPGSGKTMLARRLPTILPAMTHEECVEVTEVWSAAGLTLNGGGLVRQRPFRAPHPSVSEAGLVGGGPMVRPGEVSLAHRGVLFLDEMPEIPKRILESLRQPLEDREVLISRARQFIRLPASFQFVGSANPCPCGWAYDPSGRCRCSAMEIQKYALRISGPLMDRIDLVIFVPTLNPAEILQRTAGETSQDVRRRVTQARTEAAKRGVRENASLTREALESTDSISAGARRTLLKSVEKLSLSARVIDRVLRISRTIADLSKSDRIEEESVLEALTYRLPNKPGPPQTTESQRALA